MLSISETLKNIYRNDLFPFADSVTPKDLVIYFPTLDLTIETDQIVDDSFELNEKLCSDEDLVFGSCEASKIKLTVADVEQDLKGQWFTINQVIEGFDPIPLGKFKVDSCKKQDDLRFKDIIAYDQLKDTDINVTDWYIGLFPTGNETYTLKQFRESLLTYLGIEYEDETLPNDDMIVEKTIEPTQISGREVLKKCVELNGAFGHIGRYGKFKHIILLPGYGLYPSETLYPAEDLYPVAEDDATYIHGSIIDDTVSRYRSVKFEEYTVKEIDKLIIRSEEDDIGAITGTGSNAYVIQGNFLVFGKSASELEQIARNAFGNMAKRPYRPYEADSIGLPYVEVGDTLEFALDNPVTGYVLQRTLTGIQALQDKYIAEGNEEREQNFGINNEIIQLQGKVTRIKKDVEGVKVEVEDLAEDTASKFEQTATEISAAVGALDEQLTGEMNILAGQIVLKVDASGNIAAVELDADPSEGTSIKLKADNIALEGVVTANNYFKILADGSMKAVNGEFEGDIIGSNFIGGSILSTGWDGVSYGVNLNEILIENGILKCSKTLYADTGVTITWATTLTYDTLDTKNVITTNLNANTIGNTNPVSLIKFNELLSGGGRIQIEDAESGAIIYVRGTSGSVLLSNGNIVCNQINGSTPVTTSNISSYAATWSALNSLADRVERLEGIHNI